MTDTETRQLASKLMRQHGLKLRDEDPNGWRVVLNPRPRKRCGRCDRFAKAIEISTRFSQVNDEFHVTDVVLHEIAHALSDGGHGASFRAACRKVGCRSTGGCIIPSAVKPPGKFTGVCPDPDCHTEHYAERLPKRGSSCGNPKHGFGRGFKPEFKLTWVLTENGPDHIARIKSEIARNGVPDDLPELAHQLLPSGGRRRFNPTDGAPVGEPLRPWRERARYLPTPDDPNGVDPNAGAPKKRPHRAPVVKGHAVGQELRVSGGWRIVCQCGCDWWNKKKLDGIKSHRRHKKEVQAHD